jgi:uncharacterized protein (DUF2252 family)
MSETSTTAPAQAPEPQPGPKPAPESGSAESEIDERLTPPPSLLATILAFDDGRKPRLVRLKLKRMALDPFAFFRGTDHLYADQWPDLKPPDPGPDVILCGDLHLENFGAYSDDAGELLYDINDFDEALVGPCSIDLVRCATSILLASELWRLTPLQASGMVLGYLDKYRATVSGTKAEGTIDPRVPRLARGPIWDILGRRALANRTEFLDQNTERQKSGRRIVRDKNTHPTLEPELADTIRAAVELYGSNKNRPDFFKTIDVTGRVAGIGSLGLARYLVLVNGEGTSKTNRLFDLKECRPSALLRHASRPWPFSDPNEAARVVRAERTLQARPTAGLDVVMVGDTPYRIREMIPSENRSSLAGFNKKPNRLRVAIEEAGLLTALAHLRGAAALPDAQGTGDALTRWVAGPALDSVLAAAARFAERTRRAYRQFRTELRSPAASAVPDSLRKRYCR